MTAIWRRDNPSSFNSLIFELSCFSNSVTLSMSLYSTAVNKLFVLLILFEVYKLSLDLLRGFMALTEFSEIK